MLWRIPRFVVYARDECLQCRPQPLDLGAKFVNDLAPLIINLSEPLDLGAEFVALAQDASHVSFGFVAMTLSSRVQDVANLHLFPTKQWLSQQDS